MPLPPSQLTSKKCHHSNTDEICLQGSQLNSAIDKEIDFYEKKEAKEKKLLDSYNRF